MMAKTTFIEKGVPIPPVLRRPKTELRSQIEQLDVGDSCLFAKKQGSISSVASVVSRKFDRKFTTRQVEGACAYGEQHDETISRLA